MNFKKKKNLQKEKSHESVNKHLYSIISEFYNYPSIHEIKFDIMFSFVLSVFVFGLFGTLQLHGSVNEIIDLIKNVNNASLSILAISAGFNTTSLSIIAATNKEDLFKLFNIMDSADDKTSLLKQIITFFSFAILIQVFMLIIGLLLIVLLETIRNIDIPVISLNMYTKKIFLISFGTFWLSLIIYSMMISIRNIALMYRYILFLGSHK